MGGAGVSICVLRSRFFPFPRMSGWLCCIFTLTFSLGVHFTHAQTALTSNQFTVSCPNLNQTLVLINSPYGTICSCPDGWEYLRDTHQCANPLGSYCGAGCSSGSWYSLTQCTGFSNCCETYNYYGTCCNERRSCDTRQFPNGLQLASTPICTLVDTATCPGALCAIDLNAGSARCDCPVGWAGDRCEQFIGLPGSQSIISLNGSSWIDISFLPCPPGYFCPQNSVSSPICNCLEGYKTNTTASTGAAVEIHCPPESYCSNQTTSPTICSVGRQCPFSGMASPVDCQPGYFCDQLGLINQQPCQPGYVCPDFNTIKRSLCWSGTYCPLMNSSSLSDAVECHWLKYCPDGSSMESPCPPGMNCVHGWYRHCPSNTYATGDGAITYDKNYLVASNGLVQCQPCGRFWHSSTGASECSLTPLGRLLYIGVPIIGFAFIVFLCSLHWCWKSVKYCCCCGCLKKRQLDDRNEVHAEGGQPLPQPPAAEEDDHPCDLFVHVHLNEPGVEGDREGVVRKHDEVGLSIPRSVEGVELVSIRPGSHGAAGEVGEAAVNLKLSFITPSEAGPGVNHHLSIANEELEPGSAVEGLSNSPPSIPHPPSRPSIVPVYHHSIATPTVCMSPTVADETNQIEGEGSPLCLGRCIHTGALDLPAIRSRLSCYTFQRLYRTNKLECIDCEFSWNKSSLWICLECNDLIHSSRCDSYHQKHSYQHFKSTSHALAIHAEKQIIWCYVCNKVVLNEIEDRHSESVIKDAINKRPDNEEEVEVEEEAVDEEPHKDE